MAQVAELFADGRQRGADQATDELTCPHEWNQCLLPGSAWLGASMKRVQSARSRCDTRRSFELTGSNLA
jgi:hypothetical protein